MGAVAKRAEAVSPALLMPPGFQDFSLLAIFGLLIGFSEARLAGFEPVTRGLEVRRDTFTEVR